MPEYELTFKVRIKGVKDEDEAWYIARRLDRFPIQVTTQYGQDILPVTSVGIERPAIVSNID